MKGKKGQIAPIDGMVMGIIIIAIALAVNFSVDDKLKTVLQDTDATRTNTTTNENATYLVDVAKTLVHTPVVDVLAVMNGTVAITENATNWAHSGNTVTLKNADYNNTELKVNYTWTETYTADTYGSNATQAMINATDDIPAWIPVIIVVIIAITIIGLLKFKVF